MELNHHSGIIVPYFKDDHTIRFILERKSADLRPPYFDKALNGIGGNSDFTKDKSPRDIAVRELKEEFWMIYDPEEKLSNIIGEKISNEDAHVNATYDVETIKAIQEQGEMLLDGQIEFAGDFVVTIRPPAMKSDLTHGAAVFLRPLQRKEFRSLVGVIAELYGRVTTDNLRRGSTTEIIDIDQLAQEKYAYATGNVLDDVLRETFGAPGIRTLQSYATSTRMTGGERTFDELKAAGFTYK